MPLLSTNTFQTSQTNLFLDTQVSLALVRFPNCHLWVGDPDYSSTYPGMSVVVRPSSVCPSYFRISILSASLRPHTASRRHCWLLTWRPTWRCTWWPTWRWTRWPTWWLTKNNYSWLTCFCTWWPKWRCKWWPTLRWTRWPTRWPTWWLTRWPTWWLTKKIVLG